VNRRLILATALLVPALAFVSCKDDGNSNPIEPQSNIPQVGTQSASKPLDVKVLKVPAHSEAALAAARKTDLADVSQSLLPGNAKHDPNTPLGVIVDCFDGDAAGPFNGTSDPFANDRGCEHNTFDGDADPNNAAAFTIPRLEQLAGKRLTNVTRLEMTFAGGPPEGGSPRFSLFVDTCQPIYTQPTTSHDCPVGTATDGVWDQTVFIAADRCNDGDANVGTAQVKAAAAVGGSDATCFIDVSGGPTYPNWAAYVTAQGPGARFARWFDAAHTQNVQNFIITDQPSHYLIYRVFMRARL
jgi:hypothetical protein